MKYSRTHVLFVVLFCALIGTITLVLDACSNQQTEKQSNKITSIENEYVGSLACKSCHEKAYADWLLSDHFHAMELPNDRTVKGNFNTTFEADGVVSRFYTKDKKYFLHTEGKDGKYHDYPIKYTFGIFPLQQYLIELPGGQLQATRVSWDAKQNKWFHQYPKQKISSNDWLHWTGNGQNWNTMCASCHSTNLVKNYDFESDTYKTTFSEMNVACESCHGPGKKHTEYIQSDAYKGGERVPYSELTDATSKTNKQQIKSCAPCHTRKTDVQFNQTSGELMDNLIPEIISNENFYADGQIKNEDYEYSSFAQSKMYHNNITCSNCHNPHSGKLISVGNALCLNCHKPTYDSPGHHFHKTNTTGAQCINCHMPQKTYMGNDNRRDHSFRIPRPDQSITYQTPNTCISCHNQKSNLWASNAIRKWYGPTRRYHFSDDLLPGSLLNNKSESHLLKLLGDTSQPEIARATAAFYLGNIRTQNSVLGLLNALNDLQPMIRYHSLRSLENFPAEIWITAAQKCLTDKVRAVRIAAADLYHQLPITSIPESIKPAFVSADAENKLFLQQQTDFAVGNIMNADYAMQGKDYNSAIRFYERGLKKDSLINYARLNLSAAYSNLGKNEDALKTLLFAERIDPTNERVYYNLALLYYELGNLQLAKTNFGKAVALNANNPDIYYNYGLLLQQLKEIKQSEVILLQGYRLNQTSAKINYALAYFYLQQNKKQRAMQFAAFLQSTDPKNTAYWELFSMLGLPH